MKSGFVDKLIGRLDRLDPGSLQTHFLHLAREKGLLETIFHAVQEGICVLDGHGRLVYANRASTRLLGLPEDAIGTPMARYLREIDWPQLLELDEEEWSRLVSREVEVSYPEHRFLAFYVVPLRAVAPEESGAVVILRDVTRDREQEAQSIASERLRAVVLLAAGVAHEIGNPLNSLHIHLQLLRRELAAPQGEAPESLDHLVEVSLREVSRLDRIITQFLNAVRPRTPQLESALVRPLLDETVEFLRHEIADRKVRVEWNVEDLVPTVRIDRNQMRQVFFNLVKNAVEAMPEGGTIGIGISATDRFVAVSFSDTGEGIPAEQLGRVFDPYYTTKAKGSGLGMMIVQRIVRDHGGELEIQSEPGRGTTVTLLLPREDRMVRLLKAPRREREAEQDAAHEATP